MAQLDMTIVAPDEIAQEVLADFTNFHGWNEALGVNRVPFMKWAIIRFIKNSVKTYRARQAAELATNIDEAEIT